MTPADVWGRPDDVSTGMSLRDLDMMIQGRQRREKADYRQLATLAYWLGGYWSKRPAKPDKLMGEKSDTSRDVDDLVSEMKRRKESEDREEVIDLDEHVELDLVGEVPLDEWYWSEDDSHDDDDGT